MLGILRRLVGCNGRNILSGAETTLFLSRFAVRTQLINSNACGGFDGYFEATLSLTCYELDEEGLVVQNEILLNEIRARFGSNILVASYEQLAAGLINVAFGQMYGRLVRATARVYNLTGYTEIQWDETRGSDIPQFPQEATEKKEFGSGLSVGRWVY